MNSKIADVSFAIITGFGLLRNRCSEPGSATLLKIKRTELHNIHTQRSRLAIWTLVVNLWLGGVLVLFCEPSWCADAGPVVISVPDGFEGPARSNTQGGVTIGWVKQQPASDGGTLLQISAIEVGNSLDGITPSQRIEATEHYLLEFVKGIGQRLSDFKFGDIDHATLAGLPAARVHWTGTVSGKATVGVTYCVLVRHSVVSLQTQNVGSEVSPTMYTAIGAIEGIRLR